MKAAAKPPLCSPRCTAQRGSKLIKSNFVLNTFPRLLTLQATLTEGVDWQKIRVQIRNDLELTTA